MRANFPFEGYPPKPADGVPGMDAFAGNDAPGQSPLVEGPAELPLNTRLKFVQIGLWEARRRWLSGQTRDLGTLLAHLDEDLGRLCEALDGEEQACEMTATHG
jgi:hypothetical protein